MSDRRSPDAEGAGESAIEPARRRRLRWLCAHADGERVLDASGDGAAALLLAGEGRRAAALEREPGAVEEARRRLGATTGVESAEVEVIAGGPGANGADAKGFDTVLIADRLEDAADVATSLADARRALRPGGRIAIAVPYGTSRWLDRDEPAYLRPLLAALDEQALVVEEAELSDGQLGIVAGETAGAQGGAGVAPWLDALDAAHRRLAERSRELERRDDELEQRDREAAERGRELERAVRRRARLEERVEKLEERHRAAQARAQELRERLSERDAELAAANAAAASARERLETLRASRSFRLIRLLWKVRGAFRGRAGPRGDGEPGSR